MNSELIKKLAPLVQENKLDKIGYKLDISKIWKKEKKEEIHSKKNPIIFRNSNSFVFFLLPHAQTSAIFFVIVFEPHTNSTLLKEEV